MTQPVTSASEQMLLATPGKSLDIHGILLAIARSKLLILICGLLGAFAVWLLLLHVPATFRATVEILPPQVTRGTSVTALLNGNGGDMPFSAFGQGLQAKTQSDVFVVILQAWPLQDSLVKQFDLVNGYHVADAVAARDRLASSTIIKSSKEGFITIGIIDTDKKRSAAMANAYVDQARNFLRGMALSEASQRRVFFEGQLAKIKEDLAGAEVNFAHMQQTSGMVSLDSQARTLLEGAASLQSQITAKQVELQSLRSYSTAANPQVQIIQSEIGALQTQLNQLESRGQGGMTGRSLSSVPGSELTFVRATRELKYQEGLYDLMVKQYEGSRIDEARDAPIIQVIEPALVPDHKFGPRRTRDIRLGFLGGLGLGLVLALVRYGLRQVSPANRTRFIELRRALIRV